ncbi:MAG: response regulator [bacterium]
MSQLYPGIILSLAALIMLLLLPQLRRRAAELTPYGWGKFYAGGVLFLLSGLLLIAAVTPQLMSLFLPTVPGLLVIIALLAIALGLAFFGWGLANIVGAVASLRKQRSDEESWQSLYAHLQEVALQPFSFVEILNLSLQQLTSCAAADGAIALLHKENSTELILAAFNGVAPQTVAKLERLPVGGDVFGRTQKLGRAQVVNNLGETDELTRGLLADAGFFSTVVFPLRSARETLGCVALFSARPFHFHSGRLRAGGIASDFLAMVLRGVRQEKEITRLQEKLRPSEEAKRITEELFFRRGFGGDLKLREALEFERVRKFFDADCIKLISRDPDGEFRIKASSGGAELGLLVDRRKLSGVGRAVSERKLLLLTAPQASGAGGGYDSMPRQVLFVPVPYPERDDLVLLLESDRGTLQFSKERLSAVRVASVYLADLHFLFASQQQGERFRQSLNQIGQATTRISRAADPKNLAQALNEATALFLPEALGRMLVLGAITQDESPIVLQHRLAKPTADSVDGLLAAVLELGSLLDGERPTVFNPQKLGSELSAAAAAVLEPVFSTVTADFRPVVFEIDSGNEIGGALLLLLPTDAGGLSDSLGVLAGLVEVASLRVSALSHSPAPRVNVMPAPVMSVRRTLRILGVDDQEVIRELLANMIAGLGHEVVTAADAEEALHQFADTEFDLVIIESGLPDEAGSQLAAAIKSQSPRTPIIMLAGWDRRESETATSRLPADLVITKPFKMEQLSRAISDAQAMIS